MKPEEASHGPRRFDPAAAIRDAMEGGPARAKQLRQDADQAVEALLATCPDLASWLTDKVWRTIASGVVPATEIYVGIQNAKRYVGRGVVRETTRYTAAIMLTILRRKEITWRNVS